MYNATSYETSFIAASTAFCRLFAFSFSSYGPLPAFSADFSGGVAAIDPSDVATVAAFVGTFGTHYLSEGYLGGMAYTWYQLSMENLATAESESVNLALAASLLFQSALGANISLNPAYASFSNVSKMWTASSRGGQPINFPRCTTFSPQGECMDTGESWIETIMSPSFGPVPIIESFSNISDLLTPQHFPNDPLIAQKQQAVLNYIYAGPFCAATPGCFAANALAGLSAYFTDECPPGWQPLSNSAGYPIMSTQNPALDGATVGLPLAAGTEPMHTHTGNASFYFTCYAFEADVGSSQDIAHCGSYTFGADLLPAPSGLPFLQMPVCTYVSPSDMYNLSLPLLAFAFADSAVTTGCPPMFTPAASVDSTFMIPSGAPWGDADEEEAERTRSVLTTTTTSRDGLAGANHSHTMTLQYPATTGSGYACDHCAGCSGCSNCAFAINDVTASYASGVQPAAINIPYRQTMTCMSVNPTAPAAPIVPQLYGFVLLTLASSCPPGWMPLPPAMSGRIPIGLSALAAPMAPIGGAPITNRSYIVPPHTHEVTAQAIFTGAGIDPACQPGPDPYGISNIEYAFGGVSDPSQPGVVSVPYTLTLACVQASALEGLGLD